MKNDRIQRQDNQREMQNDHKETQTVKKETENCHIGRNKKLDLKKTTKRSQNHTEKEQKIVFSCLNF